MWFVYIFCFSWLLEKNLNLYHVFLLLFFWIWKIKFFAKLFCVYMMSPASIAVIIFDHIQIILVYQWSMMMIIDFFSFSWKNRLVFCESPKYDKKRKKFYETIDWFFHHHHHSSLPFWIRFLFCFVSNGFRLLKLTILFHFLYVSLSKKNERERKRIEKNLVRSIAVSFPIEWHKCAHCMKNIVYRERRERISREFY